MKLNGQIGALSRKWNNRKIEQQAKELQQAVADNNMRPLRDYQTNLKNTKQIKTHLHIYGRRHRNTRHEPSTSKMDALGTTTLLKNRKKKTKTHK